MEKLTAEHIRAILHYDPETGVFTRLVRSGKHQAGVSVGCVNKVLGYVLMGVEKQRLYAHRLAWLYMTGEWPEAQIDHINGDRADNRWTNLRSVTQAVNNQNLRRVRVTSKTGVQGVRLRKGMFEARLGVNRKQCLLGRFFTADEAHQAYLTAKRALHVGCTI